MTVVVGSLTLFVAKTSLSPFWAGWVGSNVRGGAAGVTLQPARPRSSGVYMWVWVGGKVAEHLTDVYKPLLGNLLFVNRIRHGFTRLTP